MTIKNSDLIPGKLYRQDKEQTYMCFTSSINDKSVTTHTSENIIFIFLYKREINEQEISGCYPFKKFGFKYYYLINSTIHYNWVYDHDLEVSWFMEVV